jgi:hypothetical protein
MGRPQHSQPLPPVEFILQAFALRQDGLVIRRDHRLGSLAHEPAGYRGADGRLMVGVAHQGRTRRISLLRIAWCLAKGEWPKGQIKTRNNDDSDLRPENLQPTQRGHNPAAVGKSSLEHRRAVDAKLIEALSGHPDASVARLGELAGLTESGASTRLGKLATKGLALSPMCVPGRSWALTAKGRELAARTIVVLDDRDHDILRIIALAPKRQLQLARETETCSLTIKRRAGLLAERGLVRRDDMKRFSITDAGLAALGPDAPQHQPWVDLERVRASTARDVVARHGQEPDDRTRAFRSKIASLGAQQGLATTRLRRQHGLASNMFTAFDLTG